MTQIRDPELSRKRDDYEEAVQTCKLACSEMEESAAELNHQRTLSTQLIEDVADLINSIAHHPKHFDSSIEGYSAGSWKVIQQASGRISGKRYYDGPLP